MGGIRKVAILKSLSSYYVKYIIKTPLVFSLFLLFFICLFLVMTSSIQLDVVQPFEAMMDGSILKLPLGSPVIMHKDILYFYFDRNERVYKGLIKGIEIGDDGIYMDISADDFPGAGEAGRKAHVDIIVGEQSLLKRMFLRAGRN
jgi:hypothetical protein